MMEDTAAAPVMTRHRMREHVFCLLYMREFAEDDFDARMDAYFALQEDMTDEIRFAVETKVSRVAERIPEIDAIIADKAKGWRTDRMSRVDLSLLRLGVYELLMDDDIPEAVAINEAVELAKSYGGNDTPSFVNGILGSLAKEK